MSQAKFAVAVTADDKTAKGVKSAEKRLGAIPKHVSSVNKTEARAVQEAATRGSRGIIRTFGQVEQAGARVFGGRSVTSGFATRLGAMRDAAAATGEGFGAAAVEGGAFASALGVVGVAAGATIGIVAAAGYAAFKLADGWAKGAASIGRTAETIGMATKDLQEFNAAAERVGVDKATSTGAAASLSQTLNDIRYNRNAESSEVFRRLGLKLKLNEDGTVDVGRMLPDIANAIGRQNSSGRRTAARYLGIPEAALPAFAQGGKALSSDMADAEKTAYIATPGDVARGKRIYRKGAITGQMKDKAIALAGSATADAAEPGYDAAISAGNKIVGGTTTFGGVVSNTFAPAAAAVERGGRAIERAAVDMGAAKAATPGRIARPGLTPEAVAAARDAQKKWGVPASVSLAQYQIESSMGQHMPPGSNNPFGIKEFDPRKPRVWAWTKEHRRGQMRREWQPFRKFSSLTEAFDEHARLLAHGKPYAQARSQLPNVEHYVSEIAPVYATDPQYRRKFMESERSFRQFDLPIPVHVTVDIPQAPTGTRVRVVAGHGSAPAVSNAMKH